MTTDRRVLVHHDVASLTGSVAARFITKVIDLLDEQEVVHISLTGGGVGTGVLRAIRSSDARDEIDWSRVHVWWSDERWVGAGHHDRNDTAAREALLDHVGVLEQNVHPFASTDDGISLDEAATRYASTLAAHSRDGVGAPVFDIMLLGVGPDGHIASLFPDTPGVLVRDRSVIAVRDSPKPPPERLSLTLSAINASDRIWLGLAGADKASALGLLLAGASTQQVPAAGVKGVKRTVFFVDAAAAAEVPENLIASEY
jgi:6-phosphogluconolactonase